MAERPVNQADDSDVGISVITSTNRPQFIYNIFANFNRQVYRKKELILILNNNAMDLNNYRNISTINENISVYQLDEDTSLGHCLNLAVEKSRYSIVTKFDDDDYYSPYYLNGVVSSFEKYNVDVLGKVTCFLYLEGKNMLLIYRPNREHRYTRRLMGATLSFRKRVFRKVKFRDVSHSEDDKFCDDCAAKNIKTYAVDKFNYVCIRRGNSKSHTWKVDEKTLMVRSKFVARTTNFRKYATRRVRSSDM